MDCAEVKPLLPSYVRDSLGGPDRNEVEEHLGTCDDCSLAVDLLRHPPATPAESATEWSVEKIFSDSAGGPEGPTASGSAGADPNPIAMPAPLAAPAPREPASVQTSRQAAPSSLIPPDSGTASAHPASPEGNDWGFEPAGEKVESPPPDESLQLAEEALGLGRGASRSRGKAVRALVWGVGGLAGLGLLGASIWVAIKVHPAATGTDVAIRVPRAEAEAPVATPHAPEPPAAADSSLAAAPSVQAGEPEGAVAVPETKASPSEDRIATAMVERAARGTAERSATTAAPKKPAPSRAAPAARQTPPAPAASATPAPAAPATETSAPPAIPAERQVPDDLDMWPVDDVVPAPTVTRSPQKSSAPAKTPAPETTAVTRPSAPVSSPATTPSADASPPSIGASESEKPKAPMTAIDRLHEATEKASAEADLDALRRLKDSWKNHLRTAFGPNRSRAKREYADCLWAIQLLTGRTDDQREALLAYRDFLISAPAGGSDAQSAARLRQLEDAAVERH